MFGQLKNVLLISTTNFALIFNSFTGCPPTISSANSNQEITSQDHQKSENLNYKYWNTLSDRKKAIPYHESGHALMAFILKLKINEFMIGAKEIVENVNGEKITQKILGNVNFTHKTLKNKILVLLGGSIAEEIVFGKKHRNNEGDVRLINASINKLSEQTSVDPEEILQIYTSITKNLLKENVNLLHALAIKIAEQKSMTGKEVYSFLNTIIVINKLKKLDLENN